MKNCARSWNEPYEGSAFSWKNAHVLYIVLMVMGGLFSIYIIYKCRHCAICHRTRKTDPELSIEEGPINSSSDAEGAAHARAHQTDVRRASTLGTGNSSEFSVLPLYEEHEQGAQCDDDAKVEQRGKYTYVLGKFWPRWKE